MKPRCHFESALLAKIVQNYIRNQTKENLAYHGYINRTLPITIHIIGLTIKLVGTLVGPINPPVMKV